jgi:6-phospho-beta-glucosidase
MKLTVIGGGGVRAPLFVASALRRAQRIHLDELCLMDIDAEKLRIFGGLSQAAARMLGSDARITTTTDPRAALDGADYIVTTIRAGGDPGRVLDERIALKHGVLGQETTGPGGFAMALRSIPALMGYADLARRLAPTAWMFNFTNPAGLVTQALRDAGYERTVGICDAANGAQLAAAGWLKLDPRRLNAEVFGLNHLSWARRVLLDGADVLPGLLADPAFIEQTMMRIFDPGLRQQVGMWMNEYLYYYHYPERAVASISAEAQTRGEEIVALNQRLIDQLRRLDMEKDLPKALQIYVAYNHRRGATYMHYAQPDAPTPEQADQVIEQITAEPDPAEGEGYAGIALDLIEAFASGTPVSTGLNVPNQGAIEGMEADDVVEVSCKVSDGVIRPDRIGAIPAPQRVLMQSVKLYERLTVQAIRERSRATAVQALMAHPLVQSYPRACALVDEYLNAHAAYAGEWA